MANRIEVITEQALSMTPEELREEMDKVGEAAKAIQMQIDQLYRDKSNLQMDRETYGKVFTLKQYPQDQ
jgi:hypothetical protein